MKLLNKLIAKVKQREFDYILERCKGFTEAERYKLMSILKPSRYEWATLTPFASWDDTLCIYIKSYNDNSTWLRFGKDGAHHFYNIDNKSAFDEKEIKKYFYPFLKKLPSIPVEIYTTMDYDKNPVIMKVVKDITKYSKYKGYIKIITDKPFELFN